MGQEKDVLIIKSDKKWKDFFIDSICEMCIRDREKDALHEISKELFLEKMKEWGVEVEGLQKEE